MPATLPSPTTSQRILDLARALLLAGGAVMVASGLGILKSRRRQNPASPSMLRATIGIMMFVALGILSARSCVRDTPEVVTANHFSSSKLPALSVIAPFPWRLDFDERNGKLTGSSSGSQLIIETSLVSDAADADSLLKAVIDGQRRLQMFQDGPLFSEPLDGLRSVGAVMTAGKGSMAMWIVRRVGQVFTVITCTSIGNRDAKAACNGVLSSLKWRTLGPL